MRARAHIEELRGGKTAIIVNELPYGVKKGGDDGVIAKIADLVKDKVLTEISELEDHSDKSGMRIQIELKREAIPQVVLNKLFKHTALQTTFGYNAVALVDGVPRTLSLLELVQHYLDFQREVVTRRSKHELRKAEERAHVLEGYLIALDNLDEVIALIRAAADTDEARRALMTRFELSEIQAQAILDLRLRALTGARAEARRGRVRRPARSGSRSCARSSATRCAIDGADQGRAARARSRSTARATTAARRSSPPRRSSSSRT